jgi:threonine/homoserine/homoserine lactone efflux protein
VDLLEVSALTVFALALLVAAGSPGPSIAALVARVLARGWRDVAPFVAAMWIGELAWLTLAIAGLSAIAETFHWVFLTVKYLGVAYLLYLAWQMWHAPVAVDAGDVMLSSGGGAGLFFSGLAVTLGNPKIMVFYLALLPTIIDIDGVTRTDWVGLSVVALIVLAVVDAAYITLATRVRVLLRSPVAMRRANRLSAAVMGGAAAAIAAR